MKTKAKKLIAGLGLALLGNFAYGQGLNGIVVEKYYRSTAADTVGQTVNGTLPIGSVTYRVYADMPAGYKLEALYGTQDLSNNPLHILKVTSSTSFFNNQDFGSSTAEAIGSAKLKNNSNALDSWFSVGAAAGGQVGVLKSEDTGGNLLFPHNPVGMLTNTTTATGIPLATQDGIIAGAPETVTFVGDAGAKAGTNFGNVSQAGNSFITQNGSVASLNGSTGLGSTNKVLIGQFTTDGVFHFELNLQIGKISDGSTINYVANNPTGAEIMIPSLTGTFGQHPTVSITSPANAANFFTGMPVNIAATAADITDSASIIAANGVSTVDFYLDGTFKGTDATAPYTFTVTPVTGGAHTLIAKATDGDGNITTSATITINETVNTLPVTAITGTAINPVIGGVVTTTVTITATATDADGPIDSVAFFANNVWVGSISGTGPYSFVWVTAARGSQSLTTKAYDQQNGVTTSSAVLINIPNPNAKPYFVQIVDTTCAVTGICLPINAKNAVVNVIGFDMVLHYNKAKVTPTGTVSAGTLVNPSFVTTSSNIDAVNGKMIITVSLNNAAPAGTFFSGIGEVICVGFNKTANFNSLDTALYTLDSVVESRYTGITNVAADPGKYITHKDSTLNATLQFWADNSALHDNGAGVLNKIYTNNAAHTNKSATYVSPNASGQFSEALTNAIMAAGVTLNIDRDVAAATSVQPVVNGFDALLTRKVVVSDVSFIPSAAQMIAMDVNMDGKISAGDVSQLNERSVLSIPEFKQAWNYNANGTKIAGKGKSKDWIFIDGTTLNTNGAYLISSIYPATDGVGFNKDKSPVMDSCIATAVTNAASCPVIGNEVYTGIMLGDVNGNFKSVSADGVIKSLSVSDDKIVFDLSKAVIDGGYITIPVSIVSKSTINALDFSMQFDGGVTYNSIVSNTPSLTTMDNLNADDATLRFTSYSLENFDITAPIVSVRVEASAVNNGDLKSLVGYLNGDQVNVEVVKGNGITSTTTANSVVSVYPNPASGTINILVAENATVQLIDLNGTSVYQTTVNANQAQVITTENLVNGVYSVKVYNNNFVSVTQVVIIK